ncbi:MAG: NTP transferase domain-containing protein [Clostridiaceae bacterium]|nr:NTP transferase domain-containing protein [Clostridiaceae bacterium]
MINVTALILAAGEGKRMKSDKAKVLHQVCGKAMIEWVYEAARNAGIGRCVAVVGHKAEQVMEYMGDKVEYVLQQQRLGTGHAVMQARSYMDKAGYILILYGDAPLISTKTIKESINYLTCERLHAVVISADVDDPAGYGRIVRDSSGGFKKIVEHRDADETERAIREINSGMYIFSSAELAEALDLLRSDNDQGEYYLTDTLEIMLSKGYRIGIFKTGDSDEVLGANDQAQLEQIAAILERRMDSLDA